MSRSLAFDLTGAGIVAVALALVLLLLGRQVEGGTIADRWPAPGAELVAAKADRLADPAGVVAARWPAPNIRLPAELEAMSRIGENRNASRSSHSEIGKPARHHHAHRYRHNGRQRLHADIDHARL